MKKLVVFLLVVLAIVVSVSGLAATVKITNSGTVNVRSTPDANGALVGRVNSGHEYEYVETASNGWLKIRLDNGSEGYISGKMGKVTDSSAIAINQNATSAQEEDKTERIIVGSHGYVTVRSKVRDYISKTFMEFFGNESYGKVNTGSLSERLEGLEDIAKMMIDVYEKYDLTDSEKYMYYEQAGSFLYSLVMIQP